VYRLNSGAAIIWLLCDGSHDIPAITREIMEAFDREEAETIHYVKETIAHFEELGLLLA
jgi:hypothetical protein